MNISLLEQQLDTATAEARRTLEMYQARAESDGRTLTPYERSQVDAATAKAKDIKARLDRVRSDQAMTHEINRILGAGAGGRRSSSRGGADLGQLFVSSDAFQWLRETRGTRPQRFSSPSVELFPSDLQATTLTGEPGSPVSGADLVIPDYQPGILPMPTRKLTIADLLAPGTTDSNAIGYFAETTYDNAADTVAEGATKPESGFVFDAVTDPVRKIAHWVPVTDEMLEDVPGLRSYINSRLRLGVQLKEDDQLLNGNGTAPNISGILDRTGLAAAVAGGSGAIANADAIAAQIAAIRVATELEPDGIVMHPTNWLTLQVMKDSQNQYMGSGPFAAPARPTLWGLPVAVTSAITLGTALVGCFKTAAQLFRHGGIRVDVSNSHSDFFVKNLTAIRAEERIALAVYRPGAFGTVTGLD